MTYLILFIICVTIILIIIISNKNKTSKTNPSKKSKSKEKISSGTLKLKLQEKLKEAFQEKYDQIEISSFSPVSITAYGFDKKNQKKVIINTFNPDSKDNEAAIKQFTSQIKAIKRLNHPNIIRILEHGENEFSCFYVTEHSDGKTLKDIIDADGMITVNKTMHIAKQILKALVHCHNNDVLHRDIRPCNIFITTEGVIKLINFGIVKILEDTLEEKQSSTIIGTPQFGSPEQLQGKGITKKSDTYSLGVVIFYMISNQFPYANPLSSFDRNVQPVNLKDLVPELSNELNSIIMSCLEKQPEKRLTSMDLWKQIHVLNN